MLQSRVICSNPFQKAVWRPRDLIEPLELSLQCLSDVCADQVKERKKKEKKNEKSTFATIFPGGKILHGELEEGFEVASVSSTDEEIKVVLRNKKGRKVSREEMWWSSEQCEGCPGGCLGCEVWKPSKKEKIET